jgi:hypothetical protein
MRLIRKPVNEIWNFLSISDSVNNSASSKKTRKKKRKKKKKRKNTQRQQRADPTMQNNLVKSLFWKHDVTATNNERAP